MNRLIVDRDKCNFCGLCALECPAVIIEVPDPEGLPFWIEGGEERCINCGHCVAVWPGYDESAGVWPCGEGVAAFPGAG